MSNRVASLLVGLAMALVIVADLGGCSAPGQAPSARLMVYLRRGASAQDVAELESYLLLDDRISGVHYVSTAEALQRYKEAHRYGTGPQLRGNPLPAAFEITLRDAAGSGAVTSYVKGSAVFTRTVDSVRAVEPGK
jgi:cell division protein FtsX